MLSAFYHIDIPGVTILTIIGILNDSYNYVLPHTIDVENFSGLHVCGFNLTEVITEIILYFLG